MLKATTESVNCSILLKNVLKHFCNLTYTKKKFVTHIENLPLHLSEKFIGDSLSITDIASRIEISRSSVSLRAFSKLSIIVIALGQKGLSCPSLTTPTCGNPAKASFPTAQPVNLPACSLHCSFNAERQAEKLRIPISKSLV